MSDNLVAFQRLLRRAEEASDEALRALGQAQNLSTGARQAERLREAWVRARMLRDAVAEIRNSRS